MTNDWRTRQKALIHAILHFTEREIMKAIASILILVSLATSGFPQGSGNENGIQEVSSYSVRIYPGCPPLLHWFCHIGG